MVKPKWKSEEDFNKYLVREYLKHGTVNEVISQHKDSLPISYAQFQRILDKWGIVKAPGPHSRLTETVEFLSHLAEERISLESLYAKTPTRFKASVATMHRVLGYVKEGVTRRLGTALIITPYTGSSKVLIAKDVSTPRVELGKQYGSITIPMGFSRRRDTRVQAVKRVLQQEVFAKQVIKRKFPKKVIPKNPKPFLFLDIADVRVEAFHLPLSRHYSDTKKFSSYKLRNYKFVEIDKLVADKSRHKLRAGIKEGLLMFQRYRQLVERNLDPNAMFGRADLNQDLTSSRL